MFSGEINSVLKLALRRTEKIIVDHLYVSFVLTANQVTNHEIVNLVQKMDRDFTYSLIKS